MSESDLPNVVEAIRARGIQISVDDDGGIILEGGELLSRERGFLRRYRAELIALLRTGTLPESDAAQTGFDKKSYNQGYWDGTGNYESAFRDGYRAAMRCSIRTLEAIKPEPQEPIISVRDVWSEVRRFEQEQKSKFGDYGVWPEEALQTLATHLCPGDRVEVLYAQTCAIVREADGGREEFPKPKSGATAVNNPVWLRGTP